MNKLRIEKNIENGIKTTVKEIDRFRWKHKNLIFIIISIFFAYIILKSDVIQSLVSTTEKWGYLDSFLVGIFFPYGLTVIPATAAFLVLANNLNPFLMAAIGAIGAVISDYIIFKFIGNRLALGFEEMIGDVSKNLRKKIKDLRIRATKSRGLQILIPIIAGFIIASPLPDELAAVLFGSVKFKLKKFLIYAYIFHFIGILIVATVGKIF